MSYQPIIFPQLINKSWAKVDLGKQARQEFSQTEQNSNPLLNPEYCDIWVKNIAKLHHADFTWGGHFEDRLQLWKGYYEGAEKLIHLGVDYNVPSGTQVITPQDCEVVHSWADTSIHNGWGGRVILKLSKAWKNAPYLILGHLSHDSLPDAGKRFQQFDLIGITGVAQENGGWFPHLHVQCVSEEFFNLYKHDLTQLDGYYLNEGNLLDIAPDPTFLVGKMI